jgi:hypothetical protein
MRISRLSDQPADGFSIKIFDAATARVGFILLSIELDSGLG